MHACLRLGADWRGFILIELLVTMTLLGLVAVPVLATFLAGYSSLAAAGDKTGALNLARQQMEQVKSMGYPEVYQYYIEQENSPHRIQNGPYLVETLVIPAGMKPRLNDAGSSPHKLLTVIVVVSWGPLEQEHSLWVASSLSHR